MRIGIDVRCLSEGRRTGVEEYTLNFLEALFGADKKNEYILFFNSGKKPKADFGWAEKYPNVSLKKFRFPNKLLNLLFWYFDWPKIDRMIGEVDIIFLPNIIFAATSKKAKLIATIHDLSFERHPETFSLKRRWWHGFVNAKKICRRADKIIAVSNSTKNDIQSLYGVNPEKIKTIRSGVSERFKIIDRNDKDLIKIKEKYALPYKFILFLGTVEPRKNIIAVVRAYGAFRKFALRENYEEFAKYKLVIAGESGWMSGKIFSEIERSPFRKDITVINSIADEDKEYLFNLASLFVYPSLFEGFGFPPLEAMACGVPVIASNNSSLPEIVADAGILIDPDRPDEIFRAMRDILGNKSLAEKLRSRGLVQAKKFRWQKSAEEFLGVVKSLED